MYVPSDSYRGRHGLLACVAGKLLEHRVDIELYKTHKKALLQYKKHESIQLFREFVTAYTHQINILNSYFLKKVSAVS